MYLWLIKESDLWSAAVTSVLAFRVHDRPWVPDSNIKEAIEAGEQAVEALRRAKKDHPLPVWKGPP